MIQGGGLGGDDKITYNHDDTRWGGDKITYNHDDTIPVVPRPRQSEVGQ